METTLTFHAALLQAEAQARRTLDAALHERLSAAVALVKTGRTFQASDGTWQVESTSQVGRVYGVNGTCSCDDVHYNKPRWCKHQLAMYVSQRVLTLMRQPSAPVVPRGWRSGRIMISSPAPRWRLRRCCCPRLPPPESHATVCGSKRRW